VRHSLVIDRLDGEARLNVANLVCSRVADAVEHPGPWVSYRVEARSDEEVA
jgi:hypothetical protein